MSVLTEDEKDLGVCLVDIGGGTIDIAIFSNGAIEFTSSVPLGGDQVTNDLAQALKTLYETVTLEKNICLVTVFLLSLVDKEVLYVDEKVIM